MCAISAGVLLLFAGLYVALANMGEEWASSIGLYMFMTGIIMFFIGLLKL